MSTSLSKSLSFSTPHQLYAEIFFSFHNQVNLTPFTMDMKTQVNSLQVESCLDLHSVIEHILSVTSEQDVRGQRSERKRVTVQAGKPRAKRAYKVDVVLTDFNAFVCSNLKGEGM